jgi:hypothetical protein
MAEESSSRLEERADYINALPADVRAGLKERMRRADTFGTLLCHIQDHPLPNAGMQAELVEFLAEEHEEACFSWQFALRRNGVPELPWE